MSAQSYPAGKSVYVEPVKAQAEAAHPAQSYAYRIGTQRLGLWLFIISDSFVFGGLMVSRFYLLGMRRPELNQYLGLAVTSILLLSSFFMNRAEVQISKGNRSGFVTSLVATMARAAVAAGADGLIVEIHPHPEHALSDGFQALTPAVFRQLMADCRKVADALGIEM